MSNLFNNCSSGTIVCIFGPKNSIKMIPAAHDDNSKYLQPENIEYAIRSEAA